MNEIDIYVFGFKLFWKMLPCFLFCSIVLTAKIKLVLIDLDHSHVFNAVNLLQRVTQKLRPHKKYPRIKHNILGVLFNA